MFLCHKNKTPHNKDGVCYLCLYEVIKLILFILLGNIYN